MTDPIVDFTKTWPYPPPKDYRLLVELTLFGQLERKSNRRRLVTNKKTGKPMFIKSAASLQYVASALQQIPGTARQKWGSLKQNLSLHVAVYYTSRRPDLNIELLEDVLQTAGVIKDDRYIREKVSLGFVDKDNPRLVLRLYEIPGER